MPVKITATQVKPVYNIPFFWPSEETRTMTQEAVDNGTIIQVVSNYNRETMTRVRTLTFKDRESLDAFRAANAAGRAAMEAYNAEFGITETIVIEDVV